MAPEGQVEAESPLESAWTHQRKRHHKVRRKGGLFTPPYVLIDIHALPKNTHTSMLLYTCIYTHTHTHAHTHTHTHEVKHATLETKVTKGLVVILLKVK